ncbi:MAG TPA: 50S ribosomal protein L22 [Dehalococcoidia bacterium]|nr:50S ribosomal protein L22 [Chloroflexota bacterium]HCI86039.1 50S ribosomal protein L22 [Dehalococcoidia bacterium]|tara:strand:- start:5089 stop:5424 length:336 start_codon:yes stop_codon:yes gene_type:complete
MAIARTRNVGISDYKLRLVMDQIRGKMVNDAMPMLRYMTSPASAEILKILKSATANAENNDLQSRDDLKIVRITADKATWIRRYRPKARGRVGAFDRPTSHITIEVDEVRN